MFAMTRPVDLVTRSLELAGKGLSTSEIARRVGVPRSTVRDWLAGRLPRGFHRRASGCPDCGGLHDLESLPPSYVYLLGMYLGDGCLSEHPRSVFKLRISLDGRYPGIAGDVERAIRLVMPRNRIGRVDFGTWHEVYAYSKRWPCLFPQHGRGRKHEREIALTRLCLSGRSPSRGASGGPPPPSALRCALPSSRPGRPPRSGARGRP
jgi:hypothetical protein